MQTRRLSAGLLLLAACNNPSAGATDPKPEPAPIRPASEPATATEPVRAQEAKPAHYDFDQRPAATTTPGPGALAQPEKAQPAAGERPAAKPGDDPAAAEPAGTRQGPSVSGEGFNVHLQSAGTHQVGKPTTVRVVLNAIAPFHCNDKYPYRFALEPAAGLEFPADVVRNMQVGAERSTMDVALTPKTVGKHTVSGELSFSVCTDDKCLIEKQKLSLSIDVVGAS